LTSPDILFDPLEADVALFVLALKTNREIARIENLNPQCRMKNHHHTFWL